MSKTTFILSAEKKGEGLYNEGRTARLHAMLESLDLPTVYVDGVYKGYRERSFLIVPNEHSVEAVRKVVMQLAQEFEQESVLEINGTDHGWLLNTDGTQEFLGEMGLFDSVDPTVTDSYTSLPGGKYIYQKGRGNV